MILLSCDCPPLGSTKNIFNGSFFNVSIQEGAVDNFVNSQMFNNVGKFLNLRQEREFQCGMRINAFLVKISTSPKL